MDFKTLYEQKKCTPDEMAAHIENRWRIGMDTAASHAPTIIKAIAKRACNDELYGVRVFTDTSFIRYAERMMREEEREKSGRANEYEFFRGK